MPGPEPLPVEPPTPAIAPIMTPALISALRCHPHLPRNAWPLVAATTLAALNRPDGIPTVYAHALEHGQGPADGRPSDEEQLAISRRVREALVKSSAICGAPKAINALMALKAVTPPHLVDDPEAPSPTRRLSEMRSTPPSEILARGQAFFDAIYGKVARRVMGRLDRCGTEDLGATARLLYGYVLSNTGVLSPAETSFVLIAGLIPQDVNPQLKGHLRGAVNGGATVEEVRAVRDVAIRICEASGMRRLGSDEPGGWGWRDEVANL